MSVTSGGAESADHLAGIPLMFDQSYSLILFQPIISLSIFARSVYHFSCLPLSLLRFQGREKVRKLPDGYQRPKTLKTPQIVRNTVTITV